MVRMIILPIHLNYVIMVTIFTVLYTISLRQTTPCMWTQSESRIPTSWRQMESFTLSTTSYILEVQFHFTRSTLNLSEETLSALSNCFKYKPRLTSCIFHSDIPVGSQDFHMLLKRLVSYMQLKVRERFWPSLHGNVGDVFFFFCCFFYKYASRTVFFISVHFRIQISRNPSHIFK